MKISILISLCLLLMTSLYGQVEIENLAELGPGVNQMEIYESNFYVSNTNRIFVSEDGETWKQIVDVNEFVANTIINCFKVFNGSIFIGTNNGLVVKNGDILEEVEKDNILYKNITELTLYQNALIFVSNRYSNARIYKLDKDQNLETLSIPVQHFPPSLISDQFTLYALFSYYNGGYVYKPEDKDWEFMSLLNDSAVYGGIVNEGKLITFLANNFEKNFLISFDYGKTAVVQPYPFFRDYRYSNLEVYNEVIFSASSSGLHYSKDTANSWSTLSLLKIVDIKVFDDHLFGLTGEGTFFKIDLKLLLNSTEVFGYVFIDENKNGLKDLDEKGVKGHMVKLGIGGFYSITNDDGRFSFNLKAGQYDLHWVQKNYFSLPDHVSHLFSLPLAENEPHHFDFGLQVEEIEDASVHLYTGALRPGFDANHLIVYRNEGSVKNSDELVMVYDAALNFQYATPAPFRHTHDTLTWKINDLKSDYINVHLSVPANIRLGTLIQSLVFVEPSLTEINKVNNYDTLTRIVTGSFDPNDKLVKEGVTEYNYVLLDQHLTYTIRFQNTGTDTAFVVRIVDNIPSDLDIESIEILGSSHPMVSSIKGNTLTFTFNDILLPDSIIDEPGSHGFIRFKVRPKPEMVSETMVSNKASIYFDYNEPIITNEVSNIFLEKIPVIETVLDYLLCAGDSISVLERNIKQPAQIKNKIQTYHHLDTIKIYNIGFRDQIIVLKETSILTGDSIFFNNIWIKEAGEYSQVLKTTSGCDSTIYMTVNLEGNVTAHKPTNNFTVKVYPNPATNFLIVQQDHLIFHKMELFNTRGTLLKKADIYSVNEHVDLKNLLQGLYLMRLSNFNETRYIRFLITE